MPFDYFDDGWIAADAVAVADADAYIHRCCFVASVDDSCNVSIVAVTVHFRVIIFQ